MNNNIYIYIYIYFKAIPFLRDLFPTFLRGIVIPHFRGIAILIPNNGDTTK
jgi:hypothetical protein